MTNDTLADFLTRIRNASLRNKTEIVTPLSKLVESVAKILKEEGYVEDYSIEEKLMTLKLKYINKKSAIMNIERVSKPGLRIYLGYNEVPKVLNGLGISIISTSKGIMTGKKAKLEKIGGEYLCRVW